MNSVPPIRELEAPDAIGLGVGERAPHVAHHLALEHGLRDAAHVHRDERMSRALRQLVHEPRDERPCPCRSRR